MANPPPPRMPPAPKKPIAPWRLSVGRALPWLLAVTVAALFVQVYLAGAGLFADARHLETHGFFGDLVFHLMPLLLVLVGFVGADWRMGVVGIVLMVQVELQYGFIDAANGLVQALHPVNGFVMLAVAFGALLRRLPWVPRPTPQQ